MMGPTSWIALVPFLALAGALVNLTVGHRWREPLPGFLATAVSGAAFVLTLIAFVGLLGGGEARTVTGWTFLTAGTFELTLGARIDTLSVLMMLIITGVGTLIHLYSVGYMHGDDRYARYFAYLNLFIAAMSTLVLADSLLLVFVGWEGVGVASYLLIGFWFSRDANASAARKAFIVNRIGDAGFLLAMFLTVATFGTLNIQAVNAAAENAAFGSGILLAIGLLLLLAATGKSAQLPLQVWLPDAMAGPTPVSALIHAATMVTAGVYLIARMGPLYAMTPQASAVVAWVGALTALIAAVSALAQTDIKKILAYSTISQLGYMFVAVGVGAYWVGIFHVFTHAFFKALLFLGAGSVIHALGGEQDIRKMGGLGKTMRITGTTGLIGTLAIAGVPLLAGFFSKDAILEYTLFSDHLFGYGTTLLYGVLLVTAVLTAFYMFRWYFGIFAGESRVDAGRVAGVHESPIFMTLPLMVLAALSVVAGYLGLPEFATGEGSNWIKGFIGRDVMPYAVAVKPAAGAAWASMAASIVAVAVGLGLAYWMYGVKRGRALETLKEGRLAQASRAGLGFDALYKNAFVAAADGSAAGTAALDRDVLDRGLTATAGLTRRLGGGVRALQTGRVRGYAFTMLISTAVLIAVLLIVRASGGAA